MNVDCETILPVQPLKTYPRLVQSTVTGTVILMRSRRSGMVLKTGTKPSTTGTFHNPGYLSDNWDDTAMVDLPGVVTLSNSD